jgi:hypothetical protein
MTATDIVFWSLVLIFMMLAVLFYRVESKHEHFTDMIPKRNSETLAIT